MHPDPAFRLDDAARGLALADGRLAHIFLAGDQPMVVHAPLVTAGAGVRFHVSRRNQAWERIEGARAIASVVVADGYVTPSWYPTGTDQVPTWNYLAIEIEGPVRAIGEAALLEQLDRLAAGHEPGLSDRPWTRDKLRDAAERSMVAAIQGFELAAEAVRVTAKLSQNKSAETRAHVADGFDRTGRPELAQRVREGG